MGRVSSRSALDGVNYMYILLHIMQMQLFKRSSILQIEKLTNSAQYIYGLNEAVFIQYMHYCPEANKVNIAKFECFSENNFLYKSLSYYKNCGKREDARFSNSYFNGIKMLFLLIVQPVHSYVGFFQTPNPMVRGSQKAVPQYVAKQFQGRIKNN